MGQNQSASAPGGLPSGGAGGGIHVVQASGSVPGTNINAHGGEDLIAASRAIPLPAPLLPRSAAPENVASALAGPDMFNELRTKFGGIVSGAVSAVATSASAVPGVLAGIGSIGSGNRGTSGVINTPKPSAPSNGAARGAVESLESAEIREADPDQDTDSTSAQASVAESPLPVPSPVLAIAADHQVRPGGDESMRSLPSIAIVHSRTQEADHRVRTEDVQSNHRYGVQNDDCSERRVPGSTQTGIEQTRVRSVAVGDSSGVSEVRELQEMWAGLALDDGAIKLVADEASGGEPLRRALEKQEQLIRMVSLAKESSERVRAAMDASEKEARRTKNALARLERLRMATAEVQDLLESAAATANIIGAAHFPDDDEMHSFTAYLRHHPPIYPESFTT